MEVWLFVYGIIAENQQNPVSLESVCLLKTYVGNDLVQRRKTSNSIIWPVRPVVDDHQLRVHLNHLRYDYISLALFSELYVCNTQFLGRFYFAYSCYFLVFIVLIHRSFAYYVGTYIDNFVRLFCKSDVNSTHCILSTSTIPASFMPHCRISPLLARLFVQLFIGTNFIPKFLEFPAFTLLPLAFSYFVNIPTKYTNSSTVSKYSSFTTRFPTVLSIKYIVIKYYTEGSR